MRAENQEDVGDDNAHRVAQQAFTGEELIREDRCLQASLRRSLRHCLSSDLVRQHCAKTAGDIIPELCGMREDAGGNSAKEMRCREITGARRKIHPGFAESLSGTTGSSEVAVAPRLSAEWILPSRSMRKERLPDFP